jgi:hypothetical protein
MVERYLFSDEAGCFTFSRAPNVSRYFIICTVTMSDLACCGGLYALRRKLVWEKAPLGDYFHATEDAQSVRDRVFEELMKYDFEIQATICEKAKAQPQVRVSRARFYKYPWFYHLKHGIARHIPDETELLVTTASIGTRKEKATFIGNLDDVMAQNVRKGAWTVDFRPAQAEPGLQVADYCAWAIQRKWERGDNRSYDIIRGRITYEYDLWRNGITMYY